MSENINNPIQNIDEPWRGHSFSEVENFIKDEFSVKQDVLVNGQTIKTINNINVLGSGNIEIPKGDDAVNPFKGWFNSEQLLRNTIRTPNLGDYAYVAGASDVPNDENPVYIYECAESGVWSNTDRVVDTSEVSTFSTGESLNQIGIDPTELSNGKPDTLAKSIDVMQLKAKLQNATMTETSLYDSNLTVDGFLAARSTNTRVKNHFYNATNYRTLFIPLQNIQEIRFEGVYASASNATGYAFINTPDVLSLIQTLSGLSAGSDIDLSDIVVSSTTWSTLGEGLREITLTSFPENSTHLLLICVGNSIGITQNNFYAFSRTGSVALTSSDIADNLTSASVDKALSANMGKDLNHRIRTRCFVGVGSGYVRVPLESVIPGSTYRLYLRETTWEIDPSLSDSHLILNASYDVEGSSVNLFYVPKSTFTNVGTKKYYEFTVPDGVSTIYVGGRAVNGYEVWFDLVTSISDEVVASLNARSRSNYFVGNGTAYSRRKIEGLIPQNTYRIYVRNTTWEIPENTLSSSFIFGVESELGQRFFGVLKPKFISSGVNKSYTFTMPDGVDSVYVGGRAVKGYEVWFDIVDDNESSTDIISLNGGIAELSLQFKDMTRIREKYPSHTVAGNNVFCLLYFSDIHNSRSCLPDIIEFRDAFTNYITESLHGGDSVTDQFSDPNPFAEVSGASSVLNVIGNHDSWANGQTLVPSLDVYNKFIAPYAQSWGITQPDDAATLGLCYYYKDYPSCALRLVVLDCMHWNSDQASWLQSVLADAISTNNVGWNNEQSYSVVIVTHYAPAPIDIERNCTFQNLYRTSPGDFLDENSNGPTSIVNQAVNNGLKFVCWLFGHTHRDFIGHLTAYPSQLAIGIDSAKYGSTWERDCVRESTGKSKNAFDIIAVDTTFNILSIKRIGNNIDKFLRQKNFLTYDFYNHQILNNH